MRCGLPTDYAGDCRYCSSRSRYRLLGGITKELLARWFVASLLGMAGLLATFSFLTLAAAVQYRWFLSVGTYQTSAFWNTFGQQWLVILLSVTLYVGVLGTWEWRLKHQQMNVTICPTVTTVDPDIYKTQIENSARYATRVHIDLGDGIFTRQLTAVEDVWWPAGMRADLHIMFQRPFDHTEAIVALAPQLAIVHAESEGDFVAFAQEMHTNGIETGIALLQETPVQAIAPALQYIDHVLIFSGDLGHFGGMADLKLLDKVRQLKRAQATA